jgi:predicted DNA-binding transcriptional regulator AlpA
MTASLSGRPRSSAPLTLKPKGRRHAWWAATMRDEDDVGMRRIRVLRLPQLIQATGLKKTTIYALQARGEFPMRIRISSPSSIMSVRANA